MGRPTRDEAVKLRNHLLKVAHREFVKHGYTETSIEAIAAQAMVSKTTIYRHYATKADLFRAVTLHATERMTTDLLLIPTENRAVHDVLTDFAAACYDDLASPDMRSMTRLAVAEAHRFPDVAYNVFAQQRSMLAPLIGYLRRMQEQGVLRLRSADHAALQFVALVSGGLRVILVPREVIDRGRDLWIADAVKLFLNGNLIEGQMTDATARS